MNRAAPIRRAWTTCFSGREQTARATIAVVQQMTPAARTIRLEIDGHPVTAAEGTTIYDAAKLVGVDIPVLCHNERYDPVGVCRMCVVDDGGRVFAAACVRPCEDAMVVKTSTPQVQR